MLSDEESKAVQAVAKTTEKSIDAAREIGGFISQYIGGPIEQAMGIWHDKLKYRRWENQIVLAQKATAFLKARGLGGPTRTLDLALAIPLLEEASLADEDALQDRWATLLANAADAKSPEVRRAYVSILAEMTTLDALVLEKLFEADREFVPFEHTPIAELWTGELPDRAMVVRRGDEVKDGKAPLDVLLSLGNLARLGLIDSAAAFGGTAILNWVSMTELGRQFVVACRPAAQE